MDVSIQGPIDVDYVGLGEELRLAVGADEAGEDFVARPHLHWTTSIVNGLRHPALAVGAKRAVESDAFHGVV